MKITTKHGDKVQFKNIPLGDVFQNEHGYTYIKMSEAVIHLYNGTTTKVNALFPETGELAMFEDYDTVYKVEAELVIL